MTQAASTGVLQRLISERIQREGPLTFAEYIRMALYEPGYGYYVTGPARMGWEGDYYTSGDVSLLFAHCLGRQLYQLWQLLGQPAPFVVLEQGAGRGTLAAGVRSWAESHHLDLHAALQYHADDIHTGQNALSPHTQETLAPAVILSNELVDAFPVHVLQKQDGRLYEVYVGIHEGRLCEMLDEPSEAAVTDYLDGYKVPWQRFPDGWRAEVNLDALRWMEQSTHLLMGPNPRRKRRGFVLTIDYGDTARKLYTSERPQGTLTCYFQHQLTNHPLLRPGAQDITAHVNFTALLATGRRLGLRQHTFTTQRQWLTGLGLYEELEQLRRTKFAILDNARASDQGQTALLQWYNLRQGAMALMDAAGMGNFKVLIMQR